MKRLTRRARAAGEARGSASRAMRGGLARVRRVDRKDVGFDWKSDEAKRVGTKHDTSLRANSNRGHAFGVDLPERDKDALLEYLKTL